MDRPPRASAAASPTFAPRPMYARTRPTVTHLRSLDSGSCPARHRPHSRARRATRGGPARDAPRRDPRRRSRCGTRARFAAAGADEVIVHRELPDDTPFGTRLRRLVADHGAGRARRARGGVDAAGDRRRPRALFVEAAAAADPAALANNCLLGRRGRDRVRRGRARGPARRTSRATTRCRAGWPRSRASGRATSGRGATSRSTSTRRSTCCCSRTRWRGRPGPPALPSAMPRPSASGSRRCAASPPTPPRSCSSPVGSRAADLRATRARHARAHPRLIEERGLRTAALAAQRGRPNRRPPRSLLGACSTATARTRLGEHRRGPRRRRAHRHPRAARRPAGADECALAPARGPVRERPPAPRLVGDPWLRDLTAAAAAAPVPVLLGGAHARRPRARCSRSGCRSRHGRRLMDLEPGYRREPLPDPEAVGEDAELVEGSATRSGATGRSPSPGSWSGPCTSRATATTGGRTPAPVAAATS